jgi:hypothetical protein
VSHQEPDAAKGRENGAGQVVDEIVTDLVGGVVNNAVGHGQGPGYPGAWDLLVRFGGLRQSQNVKIFFPSYLRPRRSYRPFD